MALAETTDRREAYAAIAHGRHRDAFSVLGPHGDAIRVFLPQARAATLCDEDGEAIAEMQRVHPDGLFEATGKAASRTNYRISVKGEGSRHLLDDPYRFGPVLGELDVWLLGEGKHKRAWQVLGSHAIEHGGRKGMSFAVWAPNASRVSVVGDFNEWDGRRHPMRLRSECGVWELFFPGLRPGSHYKYEILGPNGHRLPLKSDPFAFQMEKRPDTAALTSELPQVSLPKEWLARRAKGFAVDAPVSIYEVHLGSWLKDDHGEFLGYDELASKLVPYVKDLGFTHVEFLPISEHPFDGSWGYQPIGLFAPTSRHGDPAAFARLVEAFHDAGIGVLIDWVPGHFPSDAHGLAEFDGTKLYEHADPREGFHQDWNTLIYNFGRNEVANMLTSNALFWIDRYGIDGLRVDAVASMLYRDYSRREGEWVPNKHGGRENLEAIAFLQQTNQFLSEDQPGAVTIAEESTAFPGVSHPVEEGGLGFHYKWNMGWMHDTLQYMHENPLYRQHHHDKITFGLAYAFSEKFVLPLSHDEVVHGKGSLLGKMPGDDWQRFANLRAYYGFMWGHPGKKLLFMGGEIAQQAEWNHDRSVDWHHLEEPNHAGVQKLIRALNTLYREEPALHRFDTRPEGFSWVIGDDAQNSVFAFLRQGPDCRPVLVISNMTPRVLTDYRIGVPRPGRWTRALSTDSSDFGGSGAGTGEAVTDAQGSHGHEVSLNLTLPPLATAFFVPEG